MTTDSPVASTTDSPITPSAIRALLAGLVVLMLVAYSGLWNADFVTLDDGNHVFDNEVVATGLSWAHVKDSFTKFPAELWAPFTWISLSLDVTIFGLNPIALHVVNLLLHVIAT